MYSFPDPCNPSLQNSSHQLCPDMLEILSFGMGMFSVELIHKIILKCILIRVLAQSSEKTRRILSHIFHPNTAQGQIDSNVISSWIQSWPTAQDLPHFPALPQSKASEKKKNHSRAIWANLSNNSPCMRSETQLYLQILLFILASDIHKTYLEGRMEVKPWGDLAVLSVSTFQVFCNVVKWPLTNTSTHSFDQFVASLIWPCSIFCCIIPVETWKKHGNESP